MELNLNVKKAVCHPPGPKISDNRYNEVVYNKLYVTCRFIGIVKFQISNTMLKLFYSLDSVSFKSFYTLLKMSSHLYSTKKTHSVQKNLQCKNTCTIHNIQSYLKPLALSSEIIPNLKYQRVMLHRVYFNDYFLKMKNSQIVLIEHFNSRWFILSVNFQCRTFLMEYNIEIYNDDHK
ncbi:hypothetical protein QTP88_020180 [Uroleucon formosanum]